MRCFADGLLEWVLARGSSKSCEDVLLIIFGSDRTLKKKSTAG